MYVCYVFLNRLKDQIKDVLLCHIWLIFLSPYLVNIFGCSTSSGMSRMGGRQAIIMNSCMTVRTQTNKTLTLCHEDDADLKHRRKRG